MNFKYLLDSLKTINVSMKNISSLYILSRISLILVLMLGLLIFITIYESEKIYISIWYLFLFLLIIFRIYEANIFKHKPQKYTFAIWHKRFFILSTLTAIMFSFLGFFFMYDISISQKYYIIFVLLGLSTASIPVLSGDIRLNILYTTILLVPISIIIFFTENLPLHIIISVTFLLYFISQVFIINKSYEKKKKIDDLESQETLLHSLFKNAPLGVFTYNKYLEIIDCNDELGRIFNNSKNNIIGMNLKDLPDQRPIEMFQNYLEVGTDTYDGPYSSINGEEFWMEAKAFTIEKGDGEDFYGVGIIEDKTKEHNALEKLEQLVNHDILTGLLNRRGFAKALDGIVKHEKHESYYSILYYLDLNQFKSINDSLGHAMGDKVLLEVSDRLTKAVNKSIIICRLSGDEFILVVPYVSQEMDKLSYKSKAIADSIKDVFVEPFILDNMHLYVSASIGIVYIEPKEINTEEILRHADLSMYQAKKTIGNIAYYNSYLDIKQKNLFILQQDLAYMQSNNELKLFFQPIVDMSNNKLYAAEMLLRWEHPIKGMLSPDEFIPLAIKAGLLSKITWWLIENVCKQISQWKNEGIWKLKYISINISPHQLLENNFADELIMILEKYSIAKSEIMLEITERSLIDNFESTQEIITELKQYGVKCAIDDFGIGYSSLSYLKRLSLHTLKIDREFVKDIGKDPNELVLMQTILNIGRQFNYSIIIEGIENREQIDALLMIDRELYYQGYLFSEALEVDEFRKRILI